MKKFVFLIMLVVFLAGCTSGKTEFFPTLGYSAEAAQVTVIRERRIFGFGFSMKVLLDGAVIARLKAGQYVSFYTASGVRTIGIPDSSISAALQAGSKNFFLIQADSSQFGFDIESISEGKAHLLMSQSTPLQ